MDKVFDWFCRLSLIAIIIVLLNSFLGDIYFKFQNGFPKISEYSEAKVNPVDEPLIKRLSGRKFIELDNDNLDFVVNLQAKYSLSGKVVAKNDNFWLRNLMRTDFDEISPLDLGIVWGEISKGDDLKKSFKFKSQKTLMQTRDLDIKMSDVNKTPWKKSEVLSHVSHIHTIPVNSNIMGALLKLQKDDIVKLDGFLVDVYSKAMEPMEMTKLPNIRTDERVRNIQTNEIFLIKRVQIGKEIYK